MNVNNVLIGNKAKLQVQFSDVICNIINISNDGNTYKIRDSLQNITVLHRTKIKKYITKNQ